MVPKAADKMAEPDSTYPYIIRVSLGWRVFAYLNALAVLVLLCMLLLGYPSNLMDRTIGLVVVIFFWLPLAIYNAACAERGQVTITADTLEYRRLASVSAIRRENVIGFDYRQTKYVQYFCLRSRTDKTLLIDQPFETRRFFIGWLQSLRRIRPGEEPDDSCVPDPQEVQDMIDRQPVKWTRNDD